jgi:hypothetical protein
MIMDIECYINYFLIKFLRVKDDKIVGFDIRRGFPNRLDRKGVRSLIERYEIITFNGNSYDIPILKLALQGATCAELKYATNALIKGRLQVWRFEKEHQLEDLKIKHIDVCELLPGFNSLKIHGGRLHSEKLQDLPYPEETVLTDAEMDNVDTYCGNDLRLTKNVFVDLIPQIELRRTMSKKYKTDLLSKSDAQIAEAVIKAEVEKVIKKELGKQEIVPRAFNYVPPDFIRFGSQQLQRVLEIVKTKQFVVGSNGFTTMPKELSDLRLKIGVSTYKMGIGGLHSSEKTAFHVADASYDIWDWDVNSFYPMIILLCRLYPKQMGPYFLEVFQVLTDERLDNKAKGEKILALVLKIVINGTFGKTGSPFSVLYEPTMMIQITITGQLSLLMLIEMLEAEGIRVVSGNTDGVVMKVPKSKGAAMRAIIRRWERTTGFTMESTCYAGVYSRDVNNYIAVKTDGEVKRKGTFRPAALDKNPENDICSDAMIAYLKYGVPLETTIRGCRDVTKFLTLRNCNEGAIKHYDIGSVPHHNTKDELCRLAGYTEEDVQHGVNGPLMWWNHDLDGKVSGLAYPPVFESLDAAYASADKKLRQYKQTVYLGKAIRWYHAKNESGAIHSENSGVMVANSGGARPLMTLDGSFPDDIDYDWYVGAAEKLFL